MTLYCQKDSAPVDLSLNVSLKVYVKGQFVGGLDIVKEMVATGEFQNLVPAEKDLKTRMNELINKAPLMVFIKGSPETPRCGFSK